MFFSPSPSASTAVPRSASRRGGFTLVELLVVIGIIALLISILLPALNRARESGRSVTCASNMRQIGQIFLMYTNEQQGFMPVNRGPANSDDLWWRTNLERSGLIEDRNEISVTRGHNIHGDKARLYCPSHSIPRMTISGQGAGGWGGVSYAYPRGSQNLPTVGGDWWDFNDNLLSQNPVWGDGRPVGGTKVTQVRQPSITASLLETRSNADRADLASHEVQLFLGPDTYRLYEDIHSGAANYLFVDGHVQSIIGRSLFVNNRLNWERLVVRSHEGAAAWEN